MDNRSEIDVKDASWNKSKKNFPNLFSVDDRFNPNDEPLIEAQAKGLTFRFHGLQINIFQPDQSFIFNAQGNKPLILTPENKVALIDLMPKGKDNYVPENLSFTLATTIKGLQKFFELYPNEEQNAWGKPPPDYFVGKTNERMAKFAQQFGFEVEHDPKIESPSSYYVVGKYNTVKESFNKFTKEKPELIEGIIQRALREQEEK